MHVSAKDTIQVMSMYFARSVIENRGGVLLPRLNPFVYFLFNVKVATSFSMESTWME